MVSKGSAVTALVIGSAAVGLAVLATGSKSVPNPPSPGPNPPPPGPVNQPFWNTLTAAQQATYEDGLYEWYLKAIAPGTNPDGGGNGCQGWPSAITVPGWQLKDLANANNLMTGTDAFQIAMDTATKSSDGSNWNPGWIDGVVDAGTFKSVSFFATNPSAPIGAKAGAKSTITAGKAKLLPLRA
jgi:hypothetical protein